VEDCIFCKIIKREIPSSKVYENDYVLAFNDINPETPVHVLIKEVAKICGVFETGYRIVSNCGKDAGQTVNHLHFHLLAGKELGEKVI